MSDQINNQTKYDFIEEGDEDTARRFYDFCWMHFRNQMRLMILSYVETDEGRKEYEKYIESFLKEGNK